MPTILFLSIATNRYTEFLEPLHASILRHWSAKDVSVAFLVLTNRPDAIRPVPGAVTYIQRVEHRPWPYTTLLRYHLFLEQKERIAAADWVTYIDVDMLAVNDLGRSLLCESFGTIHPGYAMLPPGAERPFERSSASSAYIPAEYPGPYFCGGLQGGSSAHFLRLCEEITKSIDADASRNIIAAWHDESHFNRHCSVHPPVSILPASFAYPDRPEQARTWHLEGIKPVILALTKDHISYRYSWWQRPAIRTWNTLTRLGRFICRPLQKKLI